MKRFSLCTQRLKENFLLAAVKSVRIKMINGEACEKIRREFLIVEIEKIIFANKTKFSHFGFECEIARPQGVIAVETICTTHNSVREPTPYHELLHQFIVDGHTDRSICNSLRKDPVNQIPLVCRKRSEEHTSELQSHSDLVCR